MQRILKPTRTLAGWIARYLVATSVGGVEENPTFNRFSTPVSVPLKPMAWRLQYVDVASGLQIGYVTITCDVDGDCRIRPRVDVGTPLGGSSARPDRLGGSVEVAGR